MRVTGIDHYVIMTPEPERALEWYRDKLHLEPVRLEEWRAGDAPFVSLRVTDDTIIDILEADRFGENINHVALVVADVDLGELARSEEFDVVLPPSPLFGARGQGLGMYVRDPDGNLVELRTYPDADPG